MEEGQENGLVLIVQAGMVSQPERPRRTKETAGTGIQRSTSRQRFSLQGKSGPCPARRRDITHPRKHSLHSTASTSARAISDQYEDCPYPCPKATRDRANRNNSRPHFPLHDSIRKRKRQTLYMERQERRYQLLQHDASARRTRRHRASDSYQQRERNPYHRRW